MGVLHKEELVLGRLLCAVPPVPDLGIDYGFKNAFLVVPGFLIIPQSQVCYGAQLCSFPESYDYI